MTANLGNKRTGPSYFFNVGLVHLEVGASTDDRFYFSPSIITGEGLGA